MNSFGSSVKAIRKASTHLMEEPKNRLIKKQEALYADFQNYHKRKKMRNYYLTVIWKHP